MIEKCILEQDPQIEIEPEDFSEEADSTILVRERVRGTKLECTFKKVKGKIAMESSHTVTVLPKVGHQVVYSKRDVASGGYQASSSKQQSPSKKTNAKKQKRGERGERGKNKQNCNQAKNSSGARNGNSFQTKSRRKQTPPTN